MSGFSMLRRAVVATVSAGRQGADADATITTPALDLENDRIFPEGIDLSGFRQNPVVLWAHQTWIPPVGTATTLDVTSSGIRAKWRWLKDDEFADRVRNAWDQGVLRGVSVGFLPLETKPNAAGGKDIVRSRLLEFSIVPIGANPETVRAWEKTLGRRATPPLTAEQIQLVAALRRGVQEDLENMLRKWTPTSPAAPAPRPGAPIPLTQRQCLTLLLHARSRQRARDQIWQEDRLRVVAWNSPWMLNDWV